LLDSLLQEKIPQNSSDNFVETVTENIC